MKKVHRYTDQPLHAVFGMEGKGYYWWLAPCGTSVRVRINKKAYFSGAYKEELKSAWKLASPSSRCAKCERRAQ